MRSTGVLPRSVTVLLCAAMVMVLMVVGASPALALHTTTTGSAPVWYQFNVGRVADEYSSHVSVTLSNQAACSGSFQVFANGSWSYWDTPTGEDWMGVSTEISDTQFMWSGDLVPGAYFVRLGYGASPGCVLGVSGEAVESVRLIDLGWHLQETE